MKVLVEGNRINFNRGVIVPDFSNDNWDIEYIPVADYALAGLDYKKFWQWFEGSIAQQRAQSRKATKRRKIEEYKKSIGLIPKDFVDPSIDELPF